MKRRSFVFGAGSAVATGSAIVGSGAFSRVESQREVTVQTSHDKYAYLGLRRPYTTNSQNFTRYDDNGHLYIKIDDEGVDNDPNRPIGDGVNSDSFTFFDAMFKICNQGKAEAEVYVQDQDGVGSDSGEVDFYTGEASGSEGSGNDNIESIVGEGDAETVDVGQCIMIGVRTNTKGVVAPSTLYDDEVVITANAEGAGQVSE